MKMSVIKDIEKLADSVGNGLNGSLKDIQDTYTTLHKEVDVNTVEKIGNGVAQFSDSLEEVVTREMSHINNGLNSDRYKALLKQLENGADAAGVTIAKGLTPFHNATEIVLGDLERFELSNAGAAPADAAYSDNLKKLLQQVHAEYNNVCAGKFDPLPQLGIAFNAATLMLESIPAHMLAVLEKQLPIAHLESLLSHLQAAANEDKSVGLRAAHAQIGVDYSTIDYLKAGAKVSGFLEKASKAIGGALTKELSLKLNGAIKGGIGVVGGWAAALSAKLGIDAKVSEGLGFRVVPIDVAAPYFMSISAFFGLLGIGMQAAADWLVVDQAPA